MNTKFLLLISLLLFPLNSSAVVVRDDISKQKYLLDSKPDYLVYLPHEGLGVLIDSMWILTVAHTIFDDYIGLNIDVNGTKYEIENVVIHPKYKAIPRALIKGHSAKIMDFQIKNNDIALIKLTSPVNNAEPISIYTKGDELGKLFKFFGNGATGTGLSGDVKITKKDKILRYGENIVIKSDNQWLVYRFDSPDTALPLEAMQGSGDSGAPLVITIDNATHLIGLISWQYWLGDITDFKPGLYGREAYSVRLSHYVTWINSVMTAEVKVK